MICIGLIAVFWAASFAGPVQAAKLEDLGWLAGRWAATGESHVEEIWSAPQAGTMTGMFRLVAGGKVRVLEYIVISEEEDGVFYRFKHFTPDYSTWEGDGPPLVFRLEDAEEGRAVFRNTIQAEKQPAAISYMRGDDGALTIRVGGAPDAPASDGNVTFVLERK